MSCSSSMSLVMSRVFCFLSWVVFSRLRCLTVILCYLGKILFGSGVRKVGVVLLKSIGSTVGILNARTTIDNMLSLLWAIKVTVRISVC